MGVKRTPLTPLLQLLEGQPGQDTQEIPQPDAPPPPPRPLTIQTRSSSTKAQPQSTRPEPPISSQPARPPRPESAEPKRKRSPKGKDVVDKGKSQPPKEKDEAPRTKQLKTGYQGKGKEAEAQTSQGKGKGIESQSLPSAWLPAPMLHGGPLLETALQATYRMEEEVNNRSKAAENERKKRITASKTLESSEEELAKVKADLVITTRERDNVSAGLASAQRQAEDQTKRVLEAEDQLRIAKSLIEDLNKQLAAAVHEKGVAEYARDEAAESIFYPAAIREVSSTHSVATEDQPEEEITPSEDLQASGSAGKAPKEGEFQDVTVKSQHTGPEAPKEVSEPVAGIQVPSTEEPTTLAQPPQAIPVAVVPQSTGAGPVQPSPEGTILPGIEAESVPSSQDVTDEKAEK
ncbi:mediator of RNA polymerase II transcription subunit 15-like [Quercus lobata]|uniref:mediator of RNA polymerase II transcription subunit 15-like n=1 Tax=Quercus lobata TaxID=97700 RepID=UPI00124421E8|nr:mediator of RNA polymerase II transcription subunit 15-like [Quercus lobata]